MHDRGGAAVDRWPQCHRDVVPARELAGDEQPEPVAAHRVELRRVRQPGVDLLEPSPGDTQPAVLDLDDQTLPRALTLHPYRAVRRREDSGVLGQFRQQVDDVGDGMTGHRAASPALHAHPRVVLDLSHGGAQDVDERHRPTPAAGGRVTGQDDQALSVAPHPGGEVVDAEQVVQLVRIRGPALHRVDQVQLPVQQRLAPAGQVPEHVADTAP